MKPFLFIPARMESTRFPGKPLAKISGKPMIERVYEACAGVSSISGCAVCTDSEDIINFCKSREIDVVRTGSHSTGTDRVLEAAEALHVESVVNVQGDEPLISTRFLDEFISTFAEKQSSSSADDLIQASYCSATNEESVDKNVVKCLISRKSEAVSFSRLPVCSAIVNGVACYYKQIGVYAYSMDALRRFGDLGKSALEECEKIELMRWIDYIAPVPMYRSTYPAYSVDTIEDLIKVERLIEHGVSGRLS